jgi:CheY-like chemotaxis protein
MTIVAVAETRRAKVLEEAKGKGPQEPSEGRKAPHLLPIDDDVTYCKVMSRIANLKGISLTYCTSADALGLVEKWEFDGAIVDFNLGAVTGSEVANYLENVETLLPTMIVSSSKRDELGRLPSSVQEFANKSNGPDHAIDLAMAMVRRAAG